MLALFRLLSVLPLGFLQGLGWLLGWLAWLGSATYRDRLRANAAQAAVAPAAQRASIGEAGRMVAELPRLWFGAPVPVDWQGVEHLEAARRDGAGIVLLTPHLGCFEVTAQAFAERFGAITVLYRPARKRWLRPLIEQARVRPSLSTAPTTLAGVRQMIRALRSGEAVGLLPDQVPPQGMGVWAPFFGRDAYTMTLSARLAAQPGVRLLLIWGERLPRAAGFRVHVRLFGAALPADPVAAAAAINAAMEGLVRECPQQYLWGYARYKAPHAGPAAGSETP